MRHYQRLGIGFFQWFSIVAAIASILNLGHEAAGLQFADILQRILAVYSDIWHQSIMSRIWQIIDLSPPAWVNDLIALWLIIAGVCFRSYKMARDGELRIADTLTWYMELPHPEKLAEKRAHTLEQLEIVEHEKRKTLIASQRWVFYPIYLSFCFALMPLALARLFYLKPLASQITELPMTQMYHFSAEQLTEFLRFQVEALVIGLLIFFLVNGGLASLPSQ